MTPTAKLRWYRLDRYRITKNWFGRTKKRLIARVYQLQQWHELELPENTPLTREYATKILNGEIPLGEWICVPVIHAEQIVDADSNIVSTTEYEEKSPTEKDN